jgi:hypothetical protein
LHRGENHRIPAFIENPEYAASLEDIAMPRDDINNEDLAAMIAVVCYQPLGNSGDNRRSKRIVEIANQIAFWQRDLGRVAVDTANPGAGGELSWQAADISQCDLVQLAREFNADYVSKGTLGGNQQDPALARSQIYKSELCWIDIEFVELIPHELSVARFVLDGIDGDGRVDHVEAGSRTRSAGVGAMFLIKQATKDWR